MSPSVAGGWGFTALLPFLGTTQDIRRGSSREGKALRTRFMLSKYILAMGSYPAIRARIIIPYPWPSDWVMGPTPAGQPLMLPAAPAFTTYSLATSPVGMVLSSFFHES